MRETFLLPHMVLLHKLKYTLLFFAMITRKIIVVPRSEHDRNQQKNT